MNLRSSFSKILFFSVSAVMMLGVTAFVASAHAQATSAESAAKLSSEASEYFRQQIYPYVMKNCSACHGDGKSDIEYAAPNWLHKDMASTEKQIQGYLRGDKLEQTKIYLQVLTQHWAKTSPASAEDAKYGYGEKDIKNFTTVFKEYFSKIGKNVTPTPQIFQSSNKSIDKFEIDDQLKFPTKQESVNSNRLKVKQVATGSDHACVLFTDGRLKCWGLNNYSQLGRGYAGYEGVGLKMSDMQEYLPFVETGGSKVSQLSLAYDNTCLIFENGRANCFGSGRDFNFGDEKISQISMSVSTYCVLTINNSIKCLGTYGSSGRSSWDLRKYNQSYNIGDEKIVQIATGASHGCALFESGRLKCWGVNENGILSDKPDLTTVFFNKDLEYMNWGREKIIKLAIYFKTTCLLFESGKVKCWGDNSRKLISSVDGRRFIPYSPTNDLPYLKLGSEKALDISLTSSHICILFQNKKIKCWGDNTKGQLGLSLSVQQVKPFEKLDYLKIPTTDFISAGYNFNCAWNEDDIYCFGENSNGQLGQGIDAKYIPGDGLVIPEINSIVPPTLVQ